MPIGIRKQWCLTPPKCTNVLKDIDDFECDRIGLCICDAPPGETKGGRRGFLYLFKDCFLPNAVILVDDTIREDEQKMIQEWDKELPMSIEFSGVFDPHAILRIH